jgi:hypothetical protein
MVKFGLYEEQEAFVDHGLHLDEESDFIIYDIKIFKGTEHIEDEVRIIFVIHLVREEPIVC